MGPWVWKGKLVKTNGEAKRFRSFEISSAPELGNASCTELVRCVYFDSGGRGASGTRRAKKRVGRVAGNATEDEPVRQPDRVAELFTVFMPSNVSFLAKRCSHGRSGACYSDRLTFVARPSGKFVCPLLGLSSLRFRNSHRSTKTQKPTSRSGRRNNVTLFRMIPMSLNAKKIRSIPAPGREREGRERERQAGRRAGLKAESINGFACGRI